MAMKPTATAGKHRARMDCSSMEDIAEGSDAIFTAAEDLMLAGNHHAWTNGSTTEKIAEGSKATTYTVMKPTATAGKRRARMDCSSMEDIAEGSGANYLARAG